MPTNILMPALSPTMTEGKLARWVKQKGDKIAPGDVIAEIETDKATMEVEAVDEGTLTDIKIAAGTENVPVNSVIAVMLMEEEDSAAPAAKPTQQKPVPTPPPAPAISATPTAFSAPLKQAQHGNRVIASPLAKRVARERGVDLAAIKGTGPGGRIIRADVDSWVGATKTFTVPANQAPMPAIDTRRVADLLGMKYKAEPNSTVRKTIARRLTEAKQSVPHFYLTVDCAIDALMDLRKRINEREEGHKLSVNDFVIKAAAMALKKVPAANASWTESDILYYESADISVAVATENGLITPIIKNAETKHLTALSAEMKDLGIRARAGKLKPEEYQGGSFSVSNLGMYGIREFAAIINPPQACILAVGAGEKRAVVRDDALTIATMMTCTLSVDHRAVDGAVGAEYLAAFKKLIEDPLGLLL
jgi:pyruvate dehydrogenase E2 component (dihydrolipoamide acetyltransferase)